MTTEEHARIAIVAITDGPRTETELTEAINWAREARTFALILEQVLDGSMIVTWEDGQLAFRNATPEETHELKQRFLQLSCCTDDNGEFKAP